MELKYITQSQFLCDKLATLGFKRKNQSEFICKRNGFVQTLSFCHSTWQPHTRDYYIIVGLFFTELEQLAMSMGVFSAGGWGKNIGQLMPENNFKEWHVENSATEEDVQDIITEMLSLIETYAIPFLDKFSDINKLIYEIEEGNSLVPRHADYNLPLLYDIVGDRECAIRYINQELERKNHKAKISNLKTSIEQENKSKNYISPAEREYNSYKDFSNKFLKHIEHTV